MEKHEQEYLKQVRLGYNLGLGKLIEDIISSGRIEEEQICYLISDGLNNMTQIEIVTRENILNNRINKLGLASHRDMLIKEIYQWAIDGHHYPKSNDGVSPLKYIDSLKDTRAVNEHIINYGLNYIERWKMYQKLWEVPSGTKLH